MKKFVIAMVVIILIGAVLAGIGCAVFFSSDLRFDSQNVEYTEKLFETEEEFSIANLNLNAAHKIIFERGEKCSVKYVDSDVTSFAIEVRNNSLVISENRWDWKNWIKRLFYKLKTTDIVITVPEGITFDLDGELSGATEMNLPSWEYGKIDLDIAGAATVNANDISASSISLTVSGATTIIMSGKADSLRMHASGAVIMKGKSFNCPQIDVRSSGSTELDLSGMGNTLTLHASGSGRIFAKDFALERAELDISGSVESELNVSSFLKVASSGSARVYYWGDPKVEQSTSGSSKIEKRG
ncbi:MAG: DUF2807 domain-containing protein [Clostridia bacterium]|nr:DUF2807 domain-containing protein [Clostridia bacterium]